MPTSKQASLFSARGLTLGMVLFQLLKGCLSIILVMLSASLFGADIHRDAWVIAWSIQILFFKFLFGPINETFRSKFIHLKEENGEQYALSAGYSLLLFCLIICLAVVSAFFVFDNQIIRFFAPGYSQNADRVIIIKMTLSLIPTLFLSQIITLFTALLNSFRSFYLPELFGVISLFINIVLLYFFASEWGIYTLVIANYLSLSILAFLLIFYLRRHQIYPSFFRFSLKMLAPFVLFSLPLYLSYTAGQLNSWSERVIVSFLKVGHSSALDYARKFIDLPITIIIAIGTTTMTPLLATIWTKEKNSVYFRANFLNFLRMALLIIAPIVVLLGVCSTEIIELLLLRGKFSAEWVAPTAHTLSWFGFGLFGVVFYSLSGQALLIQKKSMIYALIGVGVQLLPILFNYLWLQRFGLAIFGISWCIAQYVCGIAMFGFSKAYSKNELRSLLTISVIIAISFIVIVLFKSYLVGQSNIVIISLVGFVYIIIVLLLLMLFKQDEYKQLKKIFLPNK